MHRANMCKAAVQTVQCGKTPAQGRKSHIISLFQPPETPHPTNTVRQNTISIQKIPHLCSNHLNRPIPPTQCGKTWQLAPERVEGDEGWPKPPQHKPHLLVPLTQPTFWLFFVYVPEIRLRRTVRYRWELLHRSNPQLFALRRPKTYWMNNPITY